MSTRRLGLDEVENLAVDALIGSGTIPESAKSLAKAVKAAAPSVDPVFIGKSILTVCVVTSFRIGLLYKIGSSIETPLIIEKIIFFYLNPNYSYFSTRRIKESLRSKEPTHYKDWAKTKN